MAFGKDTPPEVGKNTQFKPGESGNPDGKPKGTKHISTWIQEMMNDESFEAVILESNLKMTEYKGAPLGAIIKVAMQKAIAGDQRWADWLSKNGWGAKLDVTSNGETLKTALVEFVDAPTEEK